MDVAVLIEEAKQAYVVAGLKWLSVDHNTSLNTPSATPARTPRAIDHPRNAAKQPRPLGCRASRPFLHRVCHDLPPRGGT